MGKMALIAVACVAGLAVVAMKAPTPAILWGCLVMIGVVGIASLTAISLFGHRFPLEATLEGGQIVALKRVEQEIAMKGYPAIPESPAIEEGFGHKQIEGKVNQEDN